MAWLSKDKKEETPTPENKPAEQQAPPNPPNMEELLTKTFGAAIEPFKQQLTAIQTELDALKRPKPTETKPNEMPSVFDDENAAINARLAPLAQHQLMLQAKIVKNDLMREYGDMWTALSADIEKVLATLAPQYQADETSVRYVVDSVIGRKAKENGFRFDGQKKSFFLEDASNANENMNQGSQEDRDFANYSVSFPKGTSVSRKHFLERMGVSMKDAQEAMKKLQVVS